MDGMDFVKYNITNHAMERYAERIMGKDDAMDVRLYVKENRDKIVERINKLINYGLLFYEGIIGNHSINQFFIKDRWVVVVDPKNNNVITLYKINLLDDEVTDLFITKTLQRINEDKKEIEETQNTIYEITQKYDEEIEKSQKEIAYYENLIGSIKENIESYNTLKNNLSLDILKVKKKLQDDVEVLVQKRHF